MARQPEASVHLVEIPAARFPILVPSATVAEVVTYTEPAPLPLAPHWVLGVFGWRTKAIAVVSFDTLLTGIAATPGPRSKIVVFYPLPGTGEADFFGVLSSKEPFPRVVDESSGLAPSSTGEVESAYVAATVRLRERTLLIPSFDALKEAFYP
ncbi:MAG: chemotaxis protein CheW [Acidiferrobacterales bacterium]